MPSPKRRDSLNHNTPESTIELISLGIHELYKSAITDGGLRDGHYDLALLVTDWLAEAQAAGALEDLHHWQQRIPIHDWPAGWPRSLVQPLLFGASSHLHPLARWPRMPRLPHRSFRGPSTRAAFRSQFSRELAPPTTWEEFEADRPLLHRSLPVVATAPSSPPSPMATTPSTISPSSSGAAAANSQTPPDAPASSRPWRIRLSNSIAASSEIQRSAIPRSPQLDSTQSGDLFLAGEVAMMANWFGFAARSGREGSPLAGKVAIAPIPTANGANPVSLSVFWALAMGRGSRHKELAWQFLRFVASPERDLGITRHGTVGVRLSTWRNPELQARIPVYREVETISLGARQLPSGPAMASFAAIIDDVITRALTTNEPSSRYS